MPETPPSPVPRPISLRRLDWLQTHVRVWRDDGILSGEQAGCILDRYETPDAIRQRNARRRALRSARENAGATGGRASEKR